MGQAAGLLHLPAMLGEFPCAAIKAPPAFKICGSDPVRRVREAREASSRVSGYVKLCAARKPPHYQHKSLKYGGFCPDVVRGSGAGHDRSSL